MTAGTLSGFIGAIFALILMFFGIGAITGVDAGAPTTGPGMGHYGD